MKEDSKWDRYFGNILKPCDRAIKKQVELTMLSVVFSVQNSTLSKEDKDRLELAVYRLFKAAIAGDEPLFESEFINAFTIADKATGLVRELAIAMKGFRSLLDQTIETQKRAWLQNAGSAC